MASAAVALMSPSPSPGLDRFYRITTLLIIVGTKIIRGLLDSIHSPSNLGNVLQKYYGVLTNLFSAKKKLTWVEWKQLYPSRTSYGQSTDFDLTLLFKLLRNICEHKVKEPSTGWDQYPSVMDLSLQADIARVKYHRNVTFAHVNDTTIELSEDRFNIVWDKIKLALLNIVGKYSTPDIVKEWEEEIDKSRTGLITDGDIETFFKSFPGITVHVTNRDGSLNLNLVLETHGNLENLVKGIEKLAFQEPGITVEGAQDGSIDIQLRVNDLSALENFWKSYQTGELRKNLERVLLTEEMRKLGDEAELLVSVDEDEYLHARCFLEELLPYKKKNSAKDTVLRTAEITAEEVEVREGSIEIQLRVKDLGALESFWTSYKTGKLRDDLEKVLVTEEMRKLGDKADLIVTVPEDEYQHARCFLEELLPYKTKGEFQKASDHYVKGLELAIKMDNKIRQEKIFQKLGDLCEHTGDYTRVIEHYKKALAVAIMIDDKEGEATACGNLGYVLQSKGDYNEAIKYHEQQLQISINSGSKAGQAQAYRSLAITYEKLGNYKESIKYKEKCLVMPVHVEIDDKMGEATDYFFLGISYQLINQYPEALAYNKKSLEISRQIGWRLLEGRVHGSLGLCFINLNNFNNAVEHFEESLKIALEVNDKIGEGCAYSLLGFCKMKCGEYDEALALFDKEIRLAEDMKDKDLVCSAHLHEGAVHMLFGNNEQAKYYCEKSLEIAKAISDKDMVSSSLFVLGVIYANMALSYMEKGEEEKKEQCIANSIHSFEKYLTWDELKSEQLFEQDHFKMLFLEGMPYTGPTLMLLASNDSKNALLMSERGRARALNDLLISKYDLNRSQLRSDPITYDEIENMTSDFSVLFYINQSSQQLEECTWIICPGNLSSPIQPREFKAKCSEFLETAYRKLRVREVQCEDRSVETDDHQEQKDFSVPQMKFSAAINDIFEKFLLAAREMTKKRNIVEEDLHDDDYQSPHEGLYKSLISPVLDQLTKDEIVIIPDGALFTVPYAALRNPNTGEFLSQTKRIRLAPSLTSLKMLQESPADFHSKTGALIIGNPKVGQVMFRGQTRVISDLPCAEREAEMIGKLLGTKPFIGSQATKEVIKQSLREGVAIIHFAAHGTTDGEIFLTPSTTGALPSEQDYVLTMKDVQESGVRPQLVVLSCCHSGRGEIKAEGVVGMSRAFLAAGARAVVASLWAIADDATMVFMEKFYTHLKQGESASKSLQQAMKDMREIPRYSDPQFWAPFFLIGDDVTITMWDK